jgi:hypothetical protein
MSCFLFLDNPCFTAEKRSRVWYHHATCGHKKTTIFTSIIYGFTCSKKCVINTPADPCPLYQKIKLYLWARAAKDDMKCFWDASWSNPPAAASVSLVWAKQRFALNKVGHKRGSISDLPSNINLALLAPFMPRAYIALGGWGPWTDTLKWKYDTGGWNHTGSRFTARAEGGENL